MSEDNPNPWIERRVGDGGFLVRARSHPNRYVAYFEIISIGGTDASTGAMVYMARDGRFSERLEDAEHVWRGEVKWDGCTDWHADGPGHLCGFCDLLLLTRAMRVAYRIGFEAMGRDPKEQI
mgnify:CR=1 FL=1